MVRALDFSLRSGNFSAGAADRALPDAWRHFVRGALVHGADVDRTEIRYGARAAAGDAPGFRPTARARMVALFHVAAFQTHPRKRDSGTRAFAESRPFRLQSESPGFLERRGAGAALFAGRHPPGARCSGRALVNRCRLV